MYRVEMTEIGRHKATEIAEMSEINFDTLNRMASPHLRSRDIEFELNDEEAEGKVYAAGRQVGKFTVTKIATAATVAE